MFGIGLVGGGGELGVVRHRRVQFVAVVVGVHDVGDIGRGHNRELVVENGLDVLEINERVSIRWMVMIMEIITYSIPLPKLHIVCKP